MFAGEDYFVMGEVSIRGVEEFSEPESSGESKGSSSTFTSDGEASFTSSSNVSKFLAHLEIAVVIQIPTMKKATMPAIQMICVKLMESAALPSE